MATTNDNLNKEMWQTFGHGSPAYNAANHRQKEGILYVKQVIRRSLSPMNSPAPCLGREEGVIGGPVIKEAITPSPDGVKLQCPKCRGNECNCIRKGDPLYPLTDKAIRSGMVDFWCDNLDVEELESMRDALDVAIVEREDPDIWEEVVLADDEREPSVDGMALDKQRREDELAAKHNAGDDSGLVGSPRPFPYGRN
jgi:hypothetical protein